IVCHHKVSTYFGGHLMHQSTQKQKVQGNSRLLRSKPDGNSTSRLAPLRTSSNSLQSGGGSTDWQNVTLAGFFQKPQAA
ncbi:hypothetical protein, partial [Bradyrhizobium sp. LA2.1]|uniref:hypothetical protein n=1 Tax=Bradyrhizobium sp. LA2.1 TaxID=3156376 RepID=UPI00339B6284